MNWKALSNELCGQLAARGMALVNLTPPGMDGGPLVENRGLTIEVVKLTPKRVREYLWGHRRRTGRVGACVWAMYDEGTGTTRLGLGRIVSERVAARCEARGIDVAHPAAQEV